MKKLLLNWILKNKFKALTEKAVIDWSKMNETDQKVYIEQAKAIKEMKLFGDLMEHLKYASQETMFNKSKSWDDMYFGKAMLYSVDLMEQFIKTLSARKLK